MKVKYEFEMSSGERHEFVIDLERPSSSNQAGGADWTRLEHHQCSNCPLKPADHPFCPAAHDLERVVGAFSQVVSYDSARVNVHVGERVVSKDTDVEGALIALLDLVLASSGCPILRQHKGMARMHVPFQTPDEATLRFIGAYCVGELIAARNRERPDWTLAKLNDLFEDTIKVNQGLKVRVKSAGTQDSATSAIMGLAAQTMGAKTSMTERLEKLAGFVVPLPPELQ